MKIQLVAQGGWPKTEQYLKNLRDAHIFASLEKYGAIGVAALAAATPVDTGLTANSWSYEIVQRAGYWSIRWHNSNENKGIPIAILLQYGHATRNGGYVEGRDYINPAIQPIFDQIDAEVRKAVSSSG